MNVFTMAELDAARAATGQPWVEFVRSASLSGGIYVLEAGSVDEQTPHLEDEVYVCVAGRARFVAGADEVGVPVGPGTLLFVPAMEPHRFVDITETLQVVVIFAPPESEAASGDADS